jgi:hypothetical protein
MKRQKSIKKLTKFALSVSWSKRVREGAIKDRNRAQEFSPQSKGLGQASGAMCLTL